MRLLRLVAVFVSLWATVAGAFWQSRDSNYDISSGGGFTPSCTQSTNFLARTSGLDTTHKTNYDNLICGLVTDGAWNWLDALYVFTTADTTTAQLNLVSSSFPVTCTVCPTFSADDGYTGNATTQFLKTGFVPPSAAGSFSQFSASFGAYDLTSSTSTSFAVAIGAQDTGAGVFEDLLVLFSGANGLARVNTLGGASISFTSTNSQGSYIITTTADQVQVMYKNGVSVGTNTWTDQAITNVPEFYILARNDAGTASNFSGDKLGAAWIGGGATSGTSGIACRFSRRINTYMAAYGKSVYSDSC